MDKDRITSATAGNEKSLLKGDPENTSVSLCTEFLYTQTLCIFLSVTMVTQPDLLSSSNTILNY